MSTKSRIPNFDTVQGFDLTHIQFLDAIDRRQLALSQLNDLAAGATLAQVVTHINSILATHRTK